MKWHLPFALFPCTLLRFNHTRSERLSSPTGKPCRKIRITSILKNGWKLWSGQKQSTNMQHIHAFHTLTVCAATWNGFMQNVVAWSNEMVKDTESNEMVKDTESRRVCVLETKTAHFHLYCSLYPDCILISTGIYICSQICLVSKKVFRLLYHT